MRITLSLDDDVLRAVQERAARQQRSVGSVLSELARSALNTGEVNRHGFRPLPPRGGVVTNALVDELRLENDL